MGIENINPFYSSTQAYGRNYQTHGCYQGYNGNGVPSTLPTVQQGYKPTTEDMEKALAYLNGNYNVQANPFVQRTAKTEKPGFEGFKVPENNGTGELIPDVSNREDSIEGCPWEAYCA